MMIGTIENSCNKDIGYKGSPDVEFMMLSGDGEIKLIKLSKISDERLMEIARELAQNVMNYRKGPKAGRNYITLDRVIYDDEPLDFEYVVNVYFERLKALDES